MSDDNATSPTSALAADAFTPGAKGSVVGRQLANAALSVGARLERASSGRRHGWRIVESDGAATWAPSLDALAVAWRLDARRADAAAGLAWAALKAGHPPAAALAALELVEGWRVDVGEGGAAILSTGGRRWTARAEGRGGRLSLTLSPELDGAAPLAFLQLAALAAWVTARGELHNQP